MGRKVFVSSEISIDDRLVDVAEHDTYAALMWPWFLTALDDWGRAEANPKRLKAAIFPAISIDEEVIAAAVRIYQRVGLLQVYESEGKLYMAVPRRRWFKWQTHIRSAKRVSDGSRIPAPPEDYEAQIIEISQNASNQPSLFAQVRADARDSAQFAQGAPTLRPSPSPSPSKSLSSKHSEKSLESVGAILKQLAGGES